MIVVQCGAESDSGGGARWRAAVEVSGWPTICMNVDQEKKLMKIYMNSCKIRAHSVADGDDGDDGDDGNGDGENS